MAWYNGAWTKRFKITSDNTKVSEAVDNLFYDLNLAPAGFWAAVRSDGGDIRVTQADGVTEVAREVSGFNQGSQVGSLFFKATGLSTSVDTDFYVYYGNALATEPAADATFGKRNVWTSYLTVNHLDEASGDVTCSKSGTTGTNTGVALGATGKLRTGGTWAEATDRLSFGDNFDVTAASLTVSAWINPSALTADSYVIVSKIQSAGPLNGYMLWLDGSLPTEDRPRLTVADAVSAVHGGGTGSVLTTGSLQQVVATYDGATIRFYVNGAAQGTAAATLTPTGSSSPFVLGNESDVDANTYVGILDEVRVSTSVRSANWITTEYNNQNAPNTFWATAAQEALVTQLLWLPRQQVVRAQQRWQAVPSGMTPSDLPE